MVQQAVEEKYRLCDETLSKLLEWITSVEDKLANQEAVKEDMDELRNQINILKVTYIICIIHVWALFNFLNILGIY